MRTESTTKAIGHMIALLKRIYTQVLDIEPYNMYNIICSVDISVRGIPLPAMVRFSWSIMDGDRSSTVPNLQNFTNGESSHSTLTYPFSMAGNLLSSDLGCHASL